MTSMRLLLLFGQRDLEEGVDRLKLLWDDELGLLLDDKGDKEFFSSISIDEISYASHDS